MTPHQWSLSKQSSLKLEKWYPKGANQATAKGDGEIKFQSVLTRKIPMLWKRYEITWVDRRTWLHVPSGTPWSNGSDTHKVFELWKEAST